MAHLFCLLVPAHGDSAGVMNFTCAKNNYMDRCGEAGSQHGCCGASAAGETTANKPNLSSRYSTTLRLQPTLAKGGVGHRERTRGEEVEENKKEGEQEGERDAEERRRRRWWRVSLRPLRRHTDTHQKKKVKKSIVRGARSRGETEACETPLYLTTSAAATSCHPAGGGGEGRGTAGPGIDQGRRRKPCNSGARAQC